MVDLVAEWPPAPLRRLAVEKAAGVEAENQSDYPSKELKEKCRQTIEHIVSRLLSNIHCPLDLRHMAHWELALGPALAQSVRKQFKAAGLDIATDPHTHEIKCAIGPKDRSVATPDIPHYFDLEAHQEAVVEWQFRACRHYVEIFAANAAKGLDTPLMPCPPFHESLVPLLNSRLGSMAFSDRGTRSIVRVYTAFVSEIEGRTSLQIGAFIKTAVWE